MIKLPAQAEIIDCRRCPRLVNYREEVARTKVRRFRDWDYWGRPVPSLGPLNARLLVIGLARQHTVEIVPGGSLQAIAQATGYIARSTISVSPTSPHPPIEAMG